MKVFKSAKSVQNHIRALKRKGKSVGFIPTMGYLHNGHLSLIRRAGGENDIVVVSIFLNPTQFGPGEDYKRYPRDIKRDLNLARREEVDIIYCPSVNQMYPQDYYTYLEVEVLSKVLSGKSRPHHFRGVVTVCAKLFNIVQPDIVYLGQKDAQQAIILKQMVKDLNMPLKIKVLPTVREKDGLAMSSRNLYLSNRDREEALVLFRALKEAEGLVKKDERDTGRIKNKIKNMILKMPKAKIDYVEIVDLKLLKPVAKIKKPTLLAIAVWIKKVRLIDNTILKP